MKCYHAIAVSAGIGIGKVFRMTDGQRNYQIKAEDGAGEQLRYQRAAEEFAARNSVMTDAFRSLVGEEESNILGVQTELIADPSFRHRIEECIRQGLAAEAAVTEVCRSFADVLEHSESPVLQQRGADYRDVETQLLDILTEKHRLDLSRIPAGAVLVTEEITPSMMFRLADKGVAAILARSGGYASHASILARTMEIPVVVGFDRLLERLESDELVIVDAGYGNVYTEASEDNVEEYQAKARKNQKEKEELREFRGRETRTGDGTQVKLQANISGPDEAICAVEDGVDGAGLLRTEYMFRSRDEIPKEEEQYRALTDILEALDGQELVVRTFDLGSDKNLWGEHTILTDKTCMEHCQERGIRLWLTHNELYYPQLRAILRAAVQGPVRLLLPVVTSLDQILKVKQLIQEVGAELDLEKIRWKEPQTGVMIETAEAWQIADVLAEEVDFFSIGTNDLVSSILKEDRIHKPGHSICDPVVLQAIRDIIDAGHQAGIPVSMCGEAAAETAMTPLWIAWGLDAYSVNPAAVLSVRRAVSQWSKTEADLVAERVLQLESGQDILRYLLEVKENNRIMKGI